MVEGEGGSTIYMFCWGVGCVGNWDGLLGLWRAGDGNDMSVLDGRRGDGGEERIRPVLILIVVICCGCRIWKKG